MFFGPEDVSRLDPTNLRGRLSREEAERLGRARGGLSLPAITALGSEEACLVGHHAGPLALGGLERLEPAVAVGLARGRDLLRLDRVRTLGRAAAERLAGHVGGLSLAGLEELDAATARGLADTRGGLWLRGLRAITPEVAAALATHQGDLHLDGIETLPSEVAAALAAHSGGLSLGGLRSLSSQTAAILAEHRGPLALDGLDAIAPSIAAALAPHGGRLGLSGLRTIPPAAAVALAGHRGDLALDRLESLPVEAAAGLARHVGWLSLAALGRLDQPAAEALAGHDGWLGLPALTGSPAAVAALRDCPRIRLPRRVQGTAAPGRGAAETALPEACGLIIIGAGFAGICMAIQLLEQGRRDFLILEQAAALGGTWRDNTYPGCACDVPAHVYSYSFAQQAGWSGTFAGQAEILAYIKRVATRHGIERWIRYDTAVRKLTWDDRCRTWLAETAAGARFRARVVVSAVGGIHVPKLPRLPGLERFAGPVFHTARWRHDLDLAARRVAVIGTGASAVQVVPELAGRVEQLVVFQRSAPWVLPRSGGPASAWGRLASRLPGVHRARRAIDFLRAEARAIALTVKPKFVERAQKQAIRFVHAAVPDEAMRRKLWPDHALGCKRVLLSDDYYPALQRDNVSLVTAAIEEVRPHGIVTAGGHVHDLDAVVMATGFEPFDVSAAIEIRGRSGRALADDWRDGPQAFRGVAVAGYPNLFLLMGPNTALGHNSILFMIETQVRYVLRCLRWLDNGRLDALEVRDDVQRTYNDSLQQRIERTVWRSTTWRSGGEGGLAYRACGGWYRHASGRNHVIWPRSAIAYWATMLRADIRHFLPAADAGSSRGPTAGLSEPARPSARAA